MRSIRQTRHSGQFPQSSLFKIVFRGYVEKHHTLDEIEARIARIEAKALAQHRTDGLPDMFARDKELWRKKLREYLTDVTVRFDEQWRRFFFVDDFPENAKRFDIKLEDCLPKRRP